MGPAGPTLLLLSLPYFRSGAAFGHEIAPAAPRCAGAAPAFARYILPAICPPPAARRYYILLYLPVPLPLGNLGGCQHFLTFCLSLCGKSGATNILPTFCLSLC
jgi:hypothetical protein